MPAGIGIGQVTGLVRELRGLESAPTIVISGPGAEELAAALALGGDRSAIAVEGLPGAAAVVVRIVDGDPSEAERGVLRRLVKEQTPLVVARRGGSERIPHVLAGDVVDLESEDGGVDVDAVAGAIAGAAGAIGPSLAARLPVLRAAVSRRLVTRTAFANAALAASSRVVQPQLPLLTFAQARMLLLLGAARGETLPREPERLVRAVGPSLVAALGTGIAARAVVRRLPVRGPIVRAAIAYGGTRALGLVPFRR